MPQMRPGAGRHWEGLSERFPGTAGDGPRNFLSPAGQRRSQRGVVMGRRIGLLASVVALLALGGGVLGAAPAWATPPKHFQFPLSDSFHNDDLSAACGFDVFVVTTGNVNVTLL